MTRRASISVLSASLALSTVAALPGGSLVSEVTGAATTTHVVVLADTVHDVAGAADALLAPLGLAPERVYEHALKGFAVTAPAAAADVLAASPLVAHVEADRRFTTTAGPTGIDRIDADAVLPIGAGTTVDVDVAVLDTGIDHTHPDLDVHLRVDCWSGLLGLVGLSNGCREGSGTDDNGHGTHVAGTIGARDDGQGVVGVAPGARLWSIKVLGSALGIGATSDIIAGIDYATSEADRLEVLNLSLGGSGRSSATDRAIRGATNAGLVVVVAAGNDRADAADYTPANAPTAITVSAITDLDGRPGARATGSCSGGDDQFATYSNYGGVVDIAAPGSCITSTRNGGGTTELSGTSMAAPHVAGAAAWYVATNRVPRDATRWSATRSGLLSTSVSQTGPCGFASGVSAEPLLDLNRC